VHIGRFLTLEVMDTMLSREAEWRVGAQGGCGWELMMWNLPYESPYPPNCEPSSAPTAPTRALVSEEARRRVLPNQDATGRRFLISITKTSIPWLRHLIDDCPRSAHPSITASWTGTRCIMSLKPGQTGSITRRKVPYRSGRSRLASNHDGSALCAGRSHSERPALPRPLALRQRLSSGVRHCLSLSPLPARPPRSLRPSKTWIGPREPLKSGLPAATVRNC